MSVSHTLIQISQKIISGEINLELTVVHYLLCRLKVTIEREIAPHDQGIPFYLMVTKDFTIEQLKLMVCMPLNFDSICFSFYRLRQDFLSVLSSSTGLLAVSLLPTRRPG